MESLSDEDLVALIQQGDSGAFNHLARRWEGSLYGFSRRILGDADEASDVCQEALFKAYLNIRRLREGAKFKSWVHHIAYNLCRDRHRARKARGETVPFEEGGAEDPSLAVEGTRPSLAAAPPEEFTRQGRLKDLLGGLMAKLPEEQRRAIVLREYQGFTSEEIGEMTGVPAATVRTRIYYGLKAVRKMLKERGITQVDLDE